jgi:hypothetical protein
MPVITCPHCGRKSLPNAEAFHCRCQARQKPKPPCKFLGKPTSDKIECESCKGKVMLKLSECFIKGRCLPKSKFEKPPTNQCHGCQSYQAKSETDPL